MLDLTAREDEMTDADTDDRRERLRRLILARCPEISLADLDYLAAPESVSGVESEPMVDVMAQVAEIIEMLEQRLETEPGERRLDRRPAARCSENDPFLLKAREFSRKSVLPWILARLSAKSPAKDRTVPRYFALRHRQATLPRPTLKRPSGSRRGGLLRGQPALARVTRGALLLPGGASLRASSGRLALHGLALAVREAVRCRVATAGRPLSRSVELRASGQVRRGLARRHGI